MIIEIDIANYQDCLCKCTCDLLHDATAYIRNCIVKPVEVRSLKTAYDQFDAYQNEKHGNRKDDVVHHHKNIDKLPDKILSRIQPMLSGLRYVNIGLPSSHEDQTEKSA